LTTSPQVFHVLFCTKAFRQRSSFETFVVEGGHP
jgi:hypothetical protein